MLYFKRKSGAAAETPTALGQPPGRRRTALLSLLLALGLVFGLSALLKLRATAQEGPVSRDPMPVAAQRYRLESSYRRPVSFIGLVRAGRVSGLGFELPGTLAALTVREGSRVSAGDVLARLDTSQLQARRDAAAADLSQVEAELELARIKAQRQRNLQATGAVSEEAFDETRLRAQALDARLASLQARLTGLDIDLEKSVLRAPYDGVVAQRLVDRGAVVSASAPVLRLVAAGAREAHIGVAAEQTGLLTPGMSYRLTLRDAAFDAVLRSIRPDVDPRTLTATAVFELPESVQGLDGEPVELALYERVDMTGAWVPLSALIEGERGLWTIMELVDDGSEQVIRRQVVEILDAQGAQAYVRGSLAEGALYLADGVHRVAPGMAVTPVADPRLVDPAEATEL
ncbi:MAG: efflux RND transporter periplasmic adaptor subunit [Halieaceae bacterium]|jgi:RND family efflux transporter MFP subunit|nr:efflux RND transporter periplasmic adaptor subunit [Halieaceae bacterium]